MQYKFLTCRIQRFAKVRNVVLKRTKAPSDWQGLSLKGQANGADMKRIVNIWTKRLRSKHIEKGRNVVFEMSPWFYTGRGDIEVAMP
jgi:hypothetical protein